MFLQRDAACRRCWSGRWESVSAPALPWAAADCVRGGSRRGNDNPGYWFGVKSSSLGEVVGSWLSLEITGKTVINSRERSLHANLAPFAALWELKRLTPTPWREMPASCGVKRRCRTHLGKSLKPLPDLWDSEQQVTGIWVLSRKLKER